MIRDVIKEILLQVNTEFPIGLITDNGNDTSTIEVCNTYWVLEGTSIIIGGVDYQVISIDRDKSITVSKIPSGDTMILQLPFFIAGTPIQADIERELIRKNQTLVTPMFYLFEPIKENFNKELDAIDRETTVRIAVLNNYNKNDFTDEIFDYSVRAMRKLSEAFIQAVKKQIKTIEIQEITYSFESFAKYGNYIDNKGSKANIFRENLSGIEIFLTIKLKKQNKCLNLCNI